MGESEYTGGLRFVCIRQEYVFKIIPELIFFFFLRYKYTLKERNGQSYARFFFEMFVIPVFDNDIQPGGTPYIYTPNNIWTCRFYAQLGNKLAQRHCSSSIGRYGFINFPSNTDIR